MAGQNHKSAGGNVNYKELNHKELKEPRAAEPQPKGAKHADRDVAGR